MTDFPVIESGDWSGFERRSIPGPAGLLSVRIGGPDVAPVVFFGHSILTSSAVWHRQAVQLVAKGYRVVCLDSRGHGASEAPVPPYAMDDLVDDVIAVLDALGIARVHYVGVSQGGMTGFGLGVRYADRLESLCIIAARADAPPPFAAAWDDRIALVTKQRSVDDLAGPTAERWFGVDFLASQPTIASDLFRCIRETSADGFVGCAQAIQGLDYLDGVGAIGVPTALIIGERDNLLLQPMRDLAPLMATASFHEIEDAGHLPQLDHPAAFAAILENHLTLAHATVG
jgi:3-oxoadipate enol-lactonase